MYFKWARRHPKGYECSTAGDKRFSALVATLPDGRTIEEAYQLDLKGYREEAEKSGLPKDKLWKYGKDKDFKELISRDEKYYLYLKLWKTWASKNPKRMEELKKEAKSGVLTDKFANSDISQARALAEILNTFTKYRDDAAVNKAKQHAINVQQQFNVSKGRRGNVKVNKIKQRKPDPTVMGYIEIKLPHKNKEYGKELSPMMLGPVKHNEPNMPTATSLENLWQFSKVYSDELFKNGKIRSIFYKRQRAGFVDPENPRHKPNHKGNEFMFVWWKGEKLTRLEGVKEIYIKNYVKLVRKTAAYKKLEKMLKDGYNIVLLSPDGSPYCAAEDKDGKILKSLLVNVRHKKQFGNEMVLAGMLSGKKVWKK